MKIFKKGEKKAWLKAIAELEKFYRAVVAGGEPEQFSCPLCIVARQYNSVLASEPGRNCMFCLWQKYNKNIDCLTMCNIQRTYNKKGSRKALVRLARWRRLLKKEK